MEAISLIRFKKDLRVTDHAGLHAAISSGNRVIALYCFEPSLMNQPDWSSFHGQFTKESLIELHQNLNKLNLPLLIFTKEIQESFCLLQEYFIIKNVFSYEETGNMASYMRDIAFGKFCKKHSIIWKEFPTNGVVRKLASRDSWSQHRNERMHQPIIQPLFQKKSPTISQVLLDQTQTLSSKKKHPHIQEGGESKAHTYLQSFLGSRQSGYMFNIGKPYESTYSCSRLSPYITYGNITIKQILHAAKQQKELFKKEKKSTRHLTAFIGRLHRHDHFIQKLESETDYELKNIHPFYDTIRTKNDPEIMKARKKGNTGIPLIDASIRCLKQTGWINFRLRATLVSFICNTCMQDRKEPAHFLAGLFTDYEPGIHYSQFQMQAGTTGINQYRIYNPTKQLIEKDPEGKFIDKRVPELKDVPLPLKAEPWKIQESLFGSYEGFTLGKDYPFPIIDIEQANREARKILRDIKKMEGFRPIADAIYQKHGSRR